MIVRFEVLELYIKNCIENGLSPTWQGLRTDCLSRYRKFEKVERDNKCA